MGRSLNSHFRILFELYLWLTEVKNVSLFKIQNNTQNFKPNLSIPWSCRNLHIFVYFLITQPTQLIGLLSHWKQAVSPCADASFALGLDLGCRTKSRGPGWGHGLQLHRCPMGHLQRNPFTCSLKPSVKGENIPPLGWHSWFHWLYYFLSLELNVSTL